MTDARYWVYVLRNRADKFYIGVSDNVTRRLSDHNAGRSKWTSKFRPWELVWQTGPMSLSQARQMESLLKRQKGGMGFYQLTGLSRLGAASENPEKLQKSTCAIEKLGHYERSSGTRGGAAR